MDVVSLCPLQVDSFFWLPRPGTCSLTVICKATYELVAGAARLAEFQEPIYRRDQLWNDEPNASVYAPSDLVPFKSRADVILVGHAYSPAGPARSVVARLIVGTIDKSIEVFLDRHFSQQGELIEGERFTRMPLRWERARGGPETSNPVGVARDAEPDIYGRVPLPNLQPPGLNVTDRTDVIDPICFGPLAESWPARAKLLGRHQPSWSRQWHSRPLPTDIDTGYFSCAPADQRIDAIRDNERIVIEHLHPDEPRLVSYLPTLKPKAFIERAGAVRELALAGDTLWIDTDQALCTVTWRGRLELRQPNEEGRVLVVLAEPGRQLSWDQISKLAAAYQKAPAHAPTATIAFEAVDPENVPRGDDDVPQRLTMNLGLEEVTEIGIQVPPIRAAAGLPFVASAPATQPPPAPSGSPGELRAHGATGNPPAVPASPNDRSPAWLSSTGSQPGAGDLMGEAYAEPLAVPETLVDDDAPVAAAASPWAAPPTAEPAQPPAPARAVPPALVARPGLGGSPPLAMPAMVPKPAAPAIIPSVALPSGSLPLGGPAGAEIAPASENSYFSEEGEREPERSATEHAELLHRQPAREIVELVWYDRNAMPQIRSTRSWVELLAEINAKPSEPEPLDFDAEPPPEEDEELREQRDVVAIMTRGYVTSGASLRPTMLEAVDENGHFEPPAVLISGKLLFPFDEIQTLKATVSAVTPFVAGNKKLDDTVATVKELMQTPWLSAEMAAGQTSKVREAFKAAKVMNPSYLDEHTERMLLEQRHYQSREVFGEEWIRALMIPSMSRDRLPTYIPMSLKKQLPMFVSFDARIIAEANVQQDQYETHQSCLKVLAFGRVIRFTRAPQIH